MNENIMYSTLIANTGVESIDDGTSRGRYYSLKKDAFPDKATFEEYKNNVKYGCFHAFRAIHLGSNTPDGKKQLELANDYFNNCYKIVKRAIEFDGSFALGMKYVEYWKDHGAFASLGVDYENHGTISKQASMAKVRKFMEMDMSDILNGRERKSAIKRNKAIDNAMAKKQDAQGTPDAQ